VLSKVTYSNSGPIPTYTSGHKEKERERGLYEKVRKKTNMDLQNSHEGDVTIMLQVSFAFRYV
jgi:hypothetical protein